MQLAGSSVYSRPAEFFHRPPVRLWQTGGFFVDAPLILVRLEKTAPSRYWLKLGWFGSPIDSR